MKFRILSVLSGLLLCASMVEVAQAQAQRDNYPDNPSQSQPGQTNDQSTTGQPSHSAKKDKNVISREQVRGEIMAVDNDTLYIRGQDGVPIPIKVDDKTKLGGKTIKRRELRKKLSQELPKAQGIRAEVTVKKDRRGEVENLATSIEKAQLTDEQSRMGQGQGQNQGQGQMAPGQGQMSNRQVEVCGTAPSMHGDTLYIQGKDGLAIPVKLNQQSSVEGQKVKSRRDIEAKLRKDFRQSPDVRATLQVKERAGKPETVAVSVEKASC